MIELHGKFNIAKVFTDNIQEEAISQIINLLEQEFVSGSKVRVMPNTHAGAWCPVGMAMTINGKAVPNIVGSDIGCGIETLLLDNDHIELPKLDKIIHAYIPAGFKVRKEVHPFVYGVGLENLRCIKHIDLLRAELSMGTLGEGSHFIELGKDSNGMFYLIVHSGSRNLGNQVAEYYQKAAIKEQQTKSREIDLLMSRLKTQEAFKNLGAKRADKNLAFVEGGLFDDYIHDMGIVQRFAELNRRAILREIVKQMRFKVAESFTAVHNYIELETMILRKGAISAKEGERILIPVNMRDGSLLCMGKGNSDWNFSAPHGAGRLISRSEAKSGISLSQFKKAVKGVYSSTVGESTLGESPFAYKPMKEIADNIKDTAEVIDIVRTVYNFKAAE